MLLAVGSQLIHSTSLLFAKIFFLEKILEHYLIVACPNRTGWAINSVTAHTEEELEVEAKKVLVEFLFEEFLCLAKRYGVPRHGSSPKKEYILAELFKRARTHDNDGVPYVIFIGIACAELPVPHPKEIRWNETPMDAVIRRLNKEITEILKVSTY
jgi:hypothetical protein